MEKKKKPYKFKVTKFCDSYKNVSFLSYISSVQFRSVAQSCPTLCDPIDGSPSGSPIPGIFQARVLEWGAIAFSRKDI